MVIKGAKRKPAAKPVVQETPVIKVEEPVAAPVIETPKETRKEKKAKPVKVELDVIEEILAEEPAVEDIEE